MGITLCMTHVFVPWGFCPIPSLPSFSSTPSITYLDFPNQFPITATTVGQPEDWAKPFRLQTTTYRYLL